MSIDALRASLADRYRIERELGAGGMATVYLAQDLKHDRKVAIKVLRPELAAVIGAERFLSEIKTTANLQHPHILPLFDSGAADSFLFYVMPFITGESLRDRLTREKQLPIADAVRIASEVASALDYAHRQGIIHRDIKPENILLHDGRALVADFGIALAASKAGGTRMTETGMSLGTPQYMSPEQAMGERELDARSDVYALGAMTYEMLTGEPPFTGPTAQAIIAKVMTAKPEPVTTLRATAPATVAAAVHQAIQRLPADRPATAALFAAALEGKAGAPSDASAVAEQARRSATSRGRLIQIGGLMVVAVAAFLAGRGGRTTGAAGPSVYDVTLPDTAPITYSVSSAANLYGSPVRNLTIAPNGAFAVYVAPLGDSTALWYRSLRDATVRRIPGTTGASSPRVSPDGSRVAYFVGNHVMVTPVAGGEVRTLFEGQSLSALSWIARDTLLLMNKDGNSYALLDAGAGQLKTGVTISTRCPFGTWLAERRVMLCAFNSLFYTVDPFTATRSADLRVRGTGDKAGGLLRGSAPRLVGGRYLVYVGTDGDLRAVSYDAKSGLAGRSVALVRGVRRENIGEADYDLSDDGALIFAPGQDASVGRIVNLHRGGTAEPLPVPEAAFTRFDLSRDRRWLAASVTTSEGNELRIYDLRDGQEQTWFRAEYVRHPLWSPSGDGLVVTVRDSTRWSLLAGDPSRGAPTDTLFATDSTLLNLDPVDYHAPDDLVLMRWEAAAAFHMNPREPKPTPLPLLKNDARFPAVSPNGRVLAYQTLEGSRILVTSFPVVGKLRQVASEGVEPLWLADGELLYRSGNAWYLSRLDPATGEPLGPAVLWARDPRFYDTSGWSNRPSHDGGIIYVQSPSETTARYLRVIPNWVSKMKAAVDSVNR